MQRLAGMYTRAFILLGRDPETASPRKKRGARKKLNRENRELHPILPGLDDDAFFRALREADRQLDREAEKQSQALKDLLSEFSPEVREALTRCLDGTLPSYLIRNGLETEIRLIYGAFRCRLLLQGAESSLPDGKPIYSLSFRREGERFRMDYTEGEEEVEPENSSALTFSGIEAVVEPFDCSQQEVDQDIPWQLLLHAAMGIREKVESVFADTACNPEELTLLPLLEEVFRLFLSECGAYPLLRELAASYGLTSMEKLLAAMETCPVKRARRYARKITSLFCDRRCETLWRELYGRIRASQASYPSLAELEGRTDTSADVRGQIQTHMESHGYAGVYPDFMKINEKRHIIFRVHYAESVQKSGWLTLRYVAGSVKMDVKTVDFYSCLFRGKGRRYRTGFLFIPFENAEKERLAAHVGIAVKLAERKRLTQEEICQDRMDSPQGGWKSLILLVLSVCAVIPLLICALLALFGVIIALVSGRPDIIPAMFTEFPWWSILQGLWGVLSACISLYILYIVWKSRR